MIELYKLHWSHYVEKVRWALDFKQLDWRGIDIVAFTKKEMQRFDCAQTVPLIHDTATGVAISDSSPIIRVLPDAELRFGRRAGLHGGPGFGAYDVSTLFRPGAYLTLGYARGRWAADLHGGVHAVFDGEPGFRGDLSARYAVTKVVAPS